MMRREQWYGWLIKFVDVWKEQVSDVGRKCLAEKFPNDSPGDLDKERVIDYIWEQMSTCNFYTQLFRIVAKT